jgi:hypothetical protein
METSQYRTYKLLMWISRVKYNVLDNMNGCESLQIVMGYIYETVNIYVSHFLQNCLHQKIVSLLA